MNWLDRAIGWISPTTAVRRVRARSALDIASRAYEGARRDHRTASWQVSSTSSNAEIAGAEELLRNRSRDLVRNNGYAGQIIETVADHIVGTGIVSAPTGLRGRNLARVQDAYARWIDHCDFDGDQDLNGLLWLAIKAMAESGSSLIRIRRQAFDATTRIAPVRLQLLEPDFIDSGKNEMTPSGGWIDRGIEYDNEGRRIACWLFDAHPGDVAQWRRAAWRSQRVPADELIYLFDKQRPGQDRGVPLLAPAIMTLQDLRSYFAAELVRKRVAACMVGVITTQDSDLYLGTDANKSKAAYGPQTQRFEPGMWTRLLPGEDVKFNAPQGDSQVDQMAVQYLRETAAAAGVMYEHATGDFSRVNYSSWRAGHHGFRRRMERKQWSIAIHKGSRPIADAFTDAAFAAALIPAKPGWRHTPPGFISVDPYKDAQADLLNLRMGKVSPAELVEERGYDYLEFLAAYAAALKQSDEAFADLGGVMFDGDPRKAAAGTTVTDKAAAGTNDQAAADQAAAQAA